MILTERDIYPLLKFNSNSEYNFSIQLFFDEIKEFSICWLAEEELEIRYPNQMINKYLRYRRSGNTIEIIEKKSKGCLAHIEFNPS